MKIEITGGGIYDGAGKEVPVGTTVDVKSEPIGWKGRYRIVSDGYDGKTAVVNPVADGYVVTEKGAGWYVVTKDGAPVTKAMRKADLEGFDALSDEDKAAFVDLYKVEA